jgi:DNA-binding PadR family transcriptional regulator
MFGHQHRFRHFRGEGGHHGRHRVGFGFGGPRERGSVKYEILAVLWDGPRHGYEVMTAIEEKRGYRPSPGSIYPALQMLEDEEHVTGREVGGKRVYTITEKGSALLQKHRQDSPEQPGAEEALPYVARFARGIGAMHGAKDALKQIARVNDPELMERAIQIMERTRRELYSLLAEES